MASLLATTTPSSNQHSFEVFSQTYQKEYEKESIIHMLREVESKSEAQDNTAAVIIGVDGLVQFVSSPTSHRNVEAPERDCTNPVDVMPSPVVSTPYPVEIEIATVYEGILVTSHEEENSQPFYQHDPDDSNLVLTVETNEASKATNDNILSPAVNHNGHPVMAVTTTTARRITILASRIRDGFKKVFGGIVKNFGNLFRKRNVS
jgi:hypothetical protein